MKSNQSPVRIWAEDVVIPTYLVGEPNRHPMFLEKRVYQGSSGRVYPYPVIDRLLDEKTAETHQVVFLENRYLKLMVMPGFGGRIQYAYDKTNGYPFIYHNHVIKPALVGLAGPWLSGGIEFNWPQHHRPGTYCPVDFAITENEDDSKTLWLSEIEPMWHLRGTLGLTLYPDKAFLAIEIRLANPTPLPQSFHLWANPAVHVNEHYQSVFPPDVQAVYDHGKRDVSAFPIARGEYYKIDYSRGVDISWYKNLPVPTSYMAAKSNYDFLGGYDHQKQAGLLHVADHHYVPGKKQWVWGCGDFGKAWDRNLTDSDGPYAELMCGVFADNQPDFTWLQPFEEKTARQYFMPYRGIGYVRNATIHGAVSLEFSGNNATVGVCVTSARPGATIRLLRKGRTIWRRRSDLAPEHPVVHQAPVPRASPQEFRLEVLDRDGVELVGYTPEPKQPEAVPEPARAIPSPARIESNEALYLAGLHLEQYRHATREPEDYYREALRRDPNDIRANNALGLLLLRRGRFATAEPFFRAAIQTQTRHNPNPSDGRPHYHLGVCLCFLERLDEALAAFHKSAWDGACQDAALFQAACIESRRGRFAAALELTERALVRNARHQKAAHLQMMLLRKLGRVRLANECVRAAIARDPLDFGASNEVLLLSRMEQCGGDSVSNDRPSQALAKLLECGGKRSATPLWHSPRPAGARGPSRTWRQPLECGADRRFRSQADVIRIAGDPHTHLELAADYAHAGMFDEAIELLDRATANLDPSRRGIGVSPAPFSATSPSITAEKVRTDPDASRAPGHVAQAGLPNSVPMLFYFKGYYASLKGDSRTAKRNFNLAAQQNPDRCFPNSLDSILALEAALRYNPRDARASYYLGNLWYDKRQVEPAIERWEAARKAAPSFPTVHRNLAIAYFNKKCRPQQALKSLARAFELAPADSRILFELDLLKKRLGIPVEKRLKFLEERLPLVHAREDLLVEYVTLLNSVGRHPEALAILCERKFHPWEGGEGKVTGQYVVALVELAKAALGIDTALDLLERARSYPANLGEGKLAGAQENQILYWQGVAHGELGRRDAARQCWREASTGMREPAPAIYYNDQNPETIFYQGLALEKLHRSWHGHPACSAAKERFETLVRFGKSHLRDKPEIDYFAVSLPEFMVFDDDLQRRNEVNCRYLMALGLFGLDRRARAIAELEKVLRLDPSHQASVLRLRMFRRTGWNV